MRFQLLWLAVTLCFFSASALSLNDIPGQYDREHGTRAERIDFFNGGQSLTKNDFKINSQICSSGVFELLAGFRTEASRRYAISLPPGVTKELISQRWASGTLFEVNVTSPVVCPSAGSDIQVNTILNFFQAAKDFSPPNQTVSFVGGKRYLVFDDWSAYQYKGPSSLSPPNANSSVFDMQSIPAVYEKKQGTTPNEIRFLHPPSGNLLNYTAITVGGQACQSGEIQFAIGPNLPNTALGANLTKVLAEEASTSQLITGLTSSALSCSGIVVPSNLTLNLFIAAKSFTVNWTTVFSTYGIENGTLPFQTEPFEFEKGMKYLVIGHRTVYQDNAHAPPKSPSGNKKSSQRSIWLWAGPLIGVGGILFVLIIVGIVLWKCRAKVHASAWYTDRQTIARDKSLNRPSIDASSHKIPWHNRR